MITICLILAVWGSYKNKIKEDVKMKINYEVVTIEDCLINYEKKGKRVIINDGQIIGFVEDN